MTPERYTVFQRKRKAACSGTPSRKNLWAYTTQRYKTIVPRGKHKGIVAVRRFKALTDTGRVKFEEKFRITLGRNKYSQSLRGYVYTKHKDGYYYSDCSSIGMATLKAIGYSVGDYLLNTAGIYNSNLFQNVPVKIKNGHITNPEVLKVGDAILYIGNDPSRPLQIGHVEWVAKITREKSLEEIAREVIEGKWGNGEERKKRLAAAGYDYKTVQKAVNRVLKA